MTIRTIKFLRTKIILIFFIAVMLVSCVSRRSNIFIPVPDPGFFEQEKTIGFAFGDIIGTRDGASARIMPEWLRRYINGGIEAVEDMTEYKNKYVFIGTNRGSNQVILNKWAEVFSPVYDFPVLAAGRIEKRIIASSTMYPEYEYGAFYENFVIRSYGSSYPDTVKEDSYWIRIKTDNGNGASSEAIVYFILITTEKYAMQSVINTMFSQTENSVRITNAQAYAVKRLHQNFFEGF